MIQLVAFVLWFAAHASGSNTTAPAYPLQVTCQSRRQLNELLFSICIDDYVCAFVYAIDGGRQRHNKFWHQMRVFDLFGPRGNYSFSHGRWPTNVTVVINASAPVSCYNLTQLTPVEQALFNAVALDRMKTHKQYFSSHVCPHRNERLLFDNVTMQFHCHCPEDKDCSGDSTHTSTVTILYGLTLGFFALIVVVVFLLGLRTATK